MRVLILGAGRIGMSVGKRLRGTGDQVIGVRRRDPGLEPVMPMVFGDLAEPSTYKQIKGVFDAVLLCATPGIRRGRDNGLARGSRLIAERWPQARVVYTGTTAVYADLKGGDADEDSALGEDEESQALLAIEDGVVHLENALALRVAAIVGPRYVESRQRVKAAGEMGDITIRGDLGRPFSYVHERDLIDIVSDALQGGFGCGILNVASPLRMSYADYYKVLIERMGQRNRLTSDGSKVPARRIDARRLWGAYPGKPWRTPFEEEVASSERSKAAQRKQGAPAGTPATADAGMTGVYRNPSTGEVTGVYSNPAAGGLTGMHTRRPQSSAEIPAMSNPVTKSLTKPPAKPATADLPAATQKPPTGDMPALTRKPPPAPPKK
ncbi:MAG TPA: hypothetical protein VEL07_20335 [Planctomycetota bacterium]|nr:hypothetical protein [Planctomycetota bacterium]